jgi:formylglycine-generating enzyme
VNHSTGKPPMRSRPILKGGLAFIALGMVVSYFLNPSREPPPPSVVSPVRKRPVPDVRISEGLPTRIDAEELALAGRERDDNGLKLILCWCPPGEFSMGGGPKGLAGRFLDGEPARATLRRGFWIGKFEVTQAQWQLVMGRDLLQQRSMDPSQPRPLGDNSKRDHAGMGPDFPIYFTSYVEAREFCDRLTGAEREAGRLESAWAYSLPTEAQWEFACRAGTTTATAFGDRLGSTQANFDGTVPFNNAPPGPFLRGTKPVGSYPANAWGLHDMQGNVWEWCRDVYPRPPVRGVDPFQRPSSLDRTIRGGCWYEPGHRCLSTTRAPIRAKGGGSGLGFRVALVSTEP